MLNWRVKANVLLPLSLSLPLSNPTLFIQPGLLSLFRFHPGISVSPYHRTFSGYLEPFLGVDQRRTSGAQDPVSRLFVPWFRYVASTFSSINLILARLFRNLETIAIKRVAIFYVVVYGGLVCRVAKDRKGCFGLPLAFNVRVV